jgi:hypothetical protein
MNTKDTSKVTEIYLGRSKDWGNIYLTKHSWDCGWYWGFGYIGNSTCHMHIEEYLPQTISEVFNRTKLTQDNWYVIWDLFKQAYALKEVAAVYHCGGYITSKTTLTRALVNADKAAQANSDLELTLNLVWNYIQETLATEGAV